MKPTWGRPNRSENIEKKVLPPPEYSTDRGVTTVPCACYMERGKPQRLLRSGAITEAVLIRAVYINIGCGTVCKFVSKKVHANAREASCLKPFCPFPFFHRRIGRKRYLARRCERWDASLCCRGPQRLCCYSTVQ